MKALVTGCAGFIGSHLTDRLLADGYEVTGIDCFTDYYPRSIKESNIGDAIKYKNFTFIEKDILDVTSFPDVDYVFHQAAQAGVRASWGRDFTIYTRMNIQSTQYLLESYKEKNLKKFVYASSSSVYGDVALPMKESVRLQPVSPYGVTKLAAEHLCYLYWKNYGVPTISLRYFTVYGPRQRPDMGIYKFVRAILNGDPITIYGDGTQTRDFTYIADIVDANIKAAYSPITGESFNIGGGSRITVNELIRIIEEKCGKKGSIIYGDQQKGDVTDTLADISITLTKLGWTPHISVQDGIRSFVDWYKQYVAKDTYIVQTK
jgi:UDP-glucose 4-epimerase